MLASIDRFNDQELPVDSGRASTVRDYFLDWAAGLGGHGNRIIRVPVNSENAHICALSPPTPRSPARLPE
jgi:hypothetical protein